MSPEKPSFIRMVLKAAREASQQRGDQVARKTDGGKAHFEQLQQRVTQEQIQAQKKESEAFFRKIRQDEIRRSGHVSVQVPQEWAREQAKAWEEIARAGIEDAQQSLSNAMQSSREVRDLCAKFGIHKATDIQKLPEAAHFLTMMASLPPELQKDPHVWYEAMASLSSRLDIGVYNGSMEQSAFLEGQRLLKKATDHLDQIKNNDTSGSGISGLSKADLKTAFTEQGMGMTARPSGTSESDSNAIGEVFKEIDDGKNYVEKTKMIRRISGQSTTDSLDTLRDSAKQAFSGMTDRSPVQWVVGSEADIDSLTSPDVANFVSQLANNVDLNNDPRRLTMATLGLVYRTSGQSAAVRQEVAGIVIKARDRVEALLRGNSVPGFTIQRFDAVMYGQQLEPGQKRPVGKLLNPSDPNSAIIKPTDTDPQLLRLLGQIQYKIDTDNGYLLNDTQLSKDINSMQQEAFSLEVPLEQSKEAVTRVRELTTKAQHDRLKKQREAQGRGGVLTWAEAKHLVSPDERSKFADEKIINIQNLTDTDLELLLKGQDGQEEWFSKFLFEVYGVGRDRSQPSIPDQYKWEGFSTFLREVYGGKGEQYILPYQLMWNDKGRQEYIFKTLAFEPSDIKDKLQAVRKLLASDIDGYAQTPLVDIVQSIYDNSLNDMMAEKAKKYWEAVTFLRKKVRSPVSGNIMTNDELYCELKKMYGGDGKTSQLTPDQVKLMEQIHLQVDVAAAGTMIKDTDVLMSNEIFNQIVRMKQKLNELEIDAPSVSHLTPEEKTTMKRRIVEEMKKKQQLYTQLEERDIVSAQAGGDPDAQFLGLSPLESEVYKRTVSYLKKFTTRNPGQAGYYTLKDGRQIEIIDKDGNIKDFRIRDAIFAARMIEVGSGHMAAVGSFEVIRPMDLVNEFQSFDASGTGGKAVMWAPFMEDIVRIYNPELFAHRFSMGGPAGVSAMALLREFNLGEKGFKITRSQRWKEMQKQLEEHHGHGDQNVVAMMKVMEHAEEALGISFTEMLGPGFFAGGGILDASSWRAEAAIFDSIKQKILGNGGSAAMWENQAMAVQLIIAKTDNERSLILRRMLRRTPSKFLQLLAGEEMNGLLTRHGLLNSPDWKLCQRALTISEMSLWKNQANLARTDIDLTQAAGFNEILLPNLRELGVTDAGINAFRDLLSDTNTLMTSASGARGKTMIDKWAKAKFPMTLSYSDFDWSDSNWAQLGSTAMDRRGRDMIAMSQARDKMFELLTQPALLFPNDIKETVKAIYELRVGLVNAYADIKVAENVAKQVARVIIEMNRSRIINPALDGIKGMIGFLPGANKIMRTVRDSDYRGLSENPLLRVLTLGQSKNWSHAPHTVGDALSMAVGFKGAEANAWDEFKIAGFIAALEDEGIFIDDHNIALDLRSEYKATPVWRIFATARKYWWVVPTATLVVAATQFVDEEKKQAGGSGGGGGHH